MSSIPKATAPNQTTGRPREKVAPNIEALLLSAQKAEDPHLPRHYVIRQALQRLILTKALKPDEQVPTELELMRIFQVSRITVRQAVGQLVATGALVTHAGRGTFVAPPRIQQDLKKLTGFVEDMDALGLKASARLIKAVEIRADERVADKLRLPKGAPVTYIERIRYAEEEPLSVDLTWLPAEIGRQIVSEDLNVNPIFSLLEDKYGIKLAEAEYAIEAALASAEIAKRLGMRGGSPILLIERNTFATDGRPIDYELLHYRGDRLRYKTVLKR